jgi:hypothetical protein
MSQGASAYPVSLLLDRIITEAGCSRYEFIQALGYRDVYRGLRRLDALEKGEGHPRIIKQIAAAYPAIAQDLKLAIAATSVIKKAETEAAWLGWCKAQQESFTPYIHIEGETTIPRGITLFGVSGGKWNLIELPQSLLDLPLEEQLATLPELMHAYRRRYNGQCPFFGELTGFKFVRCLDHFRFDKDGNFIECVQKPFRRGVAFVELR